MKKLFLALALVASLQVAQAQVKSDADIQKAIDKALAAANDAKKGAKPATWMKLGQAYMNAYNNPTANITPGIDKATFNLMAGQKLPAPEQVIIGDRPYEKYVLPNVNVYFNQIGQLEITEVTHPSIEGDALGKAFEAYKAAYERGAKPKDVAEAFKNIVSKYYSDAFNAYMFGDMAKATTLFGNAAEVSLTEPSAQIDTNSVYNAAFTAAAVKDYARARTYYNKCLDMGYTNDGNVFAALSDCALADKDTLGAKRYLVDGLKMYPDNNYILTDLINLYLKINEDPAKIVELLDEAKKQMPDNPSLYYVEGNIYRDLKRNDDALAAYRKACEVDAKFAEGYFGEGIVWMNKAVEINDEAAALPLNEYKKYDELMVKVYDCFKNAIAPLEKCYELAANPDLKVLAADNLKRVYYNLRNQGADYKAGYEKYLAIVGE